MATMKEYDAADAAARYMAVDPFYQDTPPNDRERAIIMLAIRCYTMPALTEHEIERWKAGEVPKGRKDV